MVAQYLKNSRHSFLTAEQERTATPDELVEHNLALVIHVAKGYVNRGHEMADLIAVGNLGLLDAAQRFDAGRGNRFATMAVPWIKQAITRALRSAADPIRVPEYQHTLLRRIRRARRHIEQTEGRTPTLAELAEVTGVDPGLLQDLLPTSCPIHSDPDDQDAPCLADSLAAPERPVMAPELSRVLKAALGLLDERSRTIVVRVANGETLESIGQSLGISKQRVSQIKEQAYRQLRA